MNKEIKKTPLYEEHKALGAKMLTFAGWQMPLQYSSVKEEHFAVRNNAGLFDVSHMGQVFVQGGQALSFLQELVPQDLSALTENKAMYCTLTNESGGIIDDLIIYRLHQTDNTYRFLLIVNASRIENDVNRLLEMQNGFDIKIENKSDELSMIALQGSKACDIIAKLGLSTSELPKRFSIKETSLCGMDVLLARTGYTGEDGFEIIVQNENAVKLWRELLKAGEKFGLKPTGYAARDTLRLEASLLLYGQDMNEATTPVEASLSWTIKKLKQENYSGKEVITDQLVNKNTSKKLIGFKMLDNSLPRHNCEIYTENQPSGYVTSGGFSPCANLGIGLGYINTQKDFTEGTKIDIIIRGKSHPAEIIKMPFYKNLKEKNSV